MIDAFDMELVFSAHEERIDEAQGISRMIHDERTWKSSSRAPRLSAKTRMILARLCEAVGQALLRLSGYIHAEGGGIQGRKEEYAFPRK